MMKCEENKKIRNSMADFVNKFAWDIWMTGTFLPDQAYRDTIKTKKAFSKFVEDLTKNFNKTDIEYFMAVERFKSGDFTHIHALLNGLEGLSYQQIGETWRDRYGREKVEGYQKDKGANYYLTKYCVKDLCDWDLRINKTKSPKLIY
jgi:hypothetical protein